VTKTSDVAHTKSISNGAQSQVVRWRIGSRPKANSNAGRFGRRRQARKRIRDTRVSKGKAILLRRPARLQLWQRAPFLRCRCHRISAPLESGPRDPKLLHLVDQRSALQTKFGSGTFRAADHPAD
jgi:hypothetical protein